MERTKAKGLSYMPLENDYAKLCDIVLVVQGKHYPAHGAMLAFHSQFFRKMLVDLQGSSPLHASDKLVMPLDESVSAADAKLMLEILYGKKKRLITAKEAWNMVHLGDKYEIKTLMTLAEDIISYADLQFCCTSPSSDIKTHSSSSKSMQEECLDACMWLGVADRLGLERIRTQCQSVILRDMESKFRCSTTDPGAKVALDSLCQCGVAARSICEILAAFVKLSSEGTRYVCTHCKKFKDPKPDKMQTWGWMLKNEFCRCPVCKHEESMEAFFSCNVFKCDVCRRSLVKIDSDGTIKSVFDMQRVLADVKRTNQVGIGKLW